MGSPTLPSSSPNHFVHLRIELNLPNDDMIYEGSPPQDATTFDRHVEPDNHDPSINNFYDYDDGDSSSTDDDSATDKRIMTCCITASRKVSMKKTQKFQYFKLKSKIRHS